MSERPKYLYLNREIEATRKAPLNSLTGEVDIELEDQLMRLSLDHQFAESDAERERLKTWYNSLIDGREMIDVPNIKKITVLMGSGAAKRAYNMPHVRQKRWHPNPERFGCHPDAYAMMPDREKRSFDAVFDENDGMREVNQAGAGEVAYLQRRVIELEELVRKLIIKDGSRELMEMIDGAGVEEEDKPALKDAAVKIIEREVGV